MPFERLHKLVTYALVGAGLSMLLLSGELPVLAWPLVLGAAAVSWFVQQKPDARTPILWNAVLIAIFALLVLMSLSSGNWLLNAVQFAVVMVLSKLFQRRTARDYYQIYMLSFLLVVAGAVVNPSLTFAVAFLAYVVLLTWGLILLHLRRDLEERATALGEEAALAGHDHAWRARSVITGRFLAGTSLLAVLIFIGSTVIFFVFPRIGFGFFMNQGRRGHSVAGFSSRVQLGNFGRIKDNPRVIMRVELPFESGAGKSLRLRGISFDHYDGRVWSRQVVAPSLDELPLGRGNERRVTVNEPVAEPAQTIVQDIWLEPLDVDVNALFGVPRIRSIEIDQGFIQTLQGRSRAFFQDDPSGDITFTGPHDSSIKYRVNSDVPQTEPSGIQKAGTDYPAMIRLAYLQLPKMQPGPRELARDVTQGLDNPWDKARAIEKHLRSSYTYSLEGDQDPDDPLHDFLFGKKSGHCEYFATAMVVLLRSEGVPSRMVNGFYGGAWNGFGKYTEIRQGDAHAWVEAWFPGYGWMTFDPTPPSGAIWPVDTGLLATLSHWFDSLKLQWYKWIIEYDLEKQVDFFRAIGRSVASLGAGILPDSGDDNDGGRVKNAVKDIANVRTAVVLGLFVLLSWLAIFTVRWLIRRGGTKARPVPRDVVHARRAYARLVDLARKRGAEVGVATTPEELLRTLRAVEVPEAPVRVVIDIYQAVRYGERPFDAAARARVAAALAELARGGRSARESNLAMPMGGR